MTVEPHIISALSEATKAHTTTARRMDALERKFEALETTLNTRIEHLEQEMGSMNAHLDNLVREAQKTNLLLSDANAERKREWERQTRLEDEARQHARELEAQNRETYRTVGAAIWRVVQQPLGFLVAGVVAWLLIRYFPVPEKQEIPMTRSALQSEE